MRLRMRFPTLATLLLLTGLLAACGSEAPRDLAELTVLDSSYVDPLTDLPFSGPVFRTFPEDAGPARPDRVQIEGSLLDGVWDGEMTVYHPNGRVRYQGSFHRGARCGPWTENADSVPLLSTYEALVREVESMGLYPPCEDSR